MHTACAPRAKGLMISVPRRKPLSTSTGIRAADCLDDLRQDLDCGAAAIDDTPAVVRNNNSVDAVVGREFRILARNDLRLDGVSQALDKIPGQIRGVQAGDAAEIDAIEIRFTCDKFAKSSAMAPIALPRIGAPQADERFPIWWRGTVDGECDHGR